MLSYVSVWLMSYGWCVYNRHLLAAFCLYSQPAHIHVKCLHQVLHLFTHFQEIFVVLPNSAQWQMDADMLIFQVLLFPSLLFSD